MSHTYKNTTDQDLVIPDLGIVAAGETITTEKVVENPNLQYVGEAAKTIESQKTTAEETN